MDVGIMTGQIFDTPNLFCEACGRYFTQINAYSNHVGSCRPQKKRMASALETAKEKYRSKKSRLDVASITQPDPPDRLEGSSQPIQSPAISQVSFGFVSNF